VLDDESTPETRTSPQSQRNWWRFRFPWVKTAVGTPTADDETVLIDNLTDEEWVLHLSFHALGTVAPHRQQTIKIVKWQMLTARQFHAPLGTEYLTADLTPRVKAVEIRHDARHGQLAYYLHPVPR
jgi:hypothetical protein